MMKQERNELVTQTGPGSPAGNVMRQYWIPAALSDELEGERPITPVRLLGEDLVLFRDDDGALGLIDRQCPHRGIDLCYGRLEDGGLRCPFHGWLFAVDGSCLEQPGEPIDSTFHHKVKSKAYPVVERNGIVFAFMGSGKPPALPDFDCFRAPDSHVFAFKGLWECNWLQALEVGIDPVHASFLHRFFEDENPDDHYGKQFRDTAADTGIPITKVLRNYDRPEITVEETDSGLRLTTLRQLDNGQTHVRITNQVFPCAITIPMSKDMNITQWHVPIDDENCYWYSMFTSFTDPVDKIKMREQRLAEHTLPGYVPVRNKSNAYGYDAQEQKTQTYTGMGMDINVYDQWACESMGPVQDRTKEHLGTTDIAISAYRRMLLKTITKIENGETDLPGTLGEGEAKSLQGPIALDVVGVSDGSDSIWRDGDRERREACSWDARL